VNKILVGNKADMDESKRVSGGTAPRAGSKCEHAGLASTQFGAWQEKCRGEVQDRGAGEKPR